MLRFVFVIVVASVAATTIPAYLMAHRDRLVARPAPAAGPSEATAEAATAPEPPRYAGRQVELSRDGRGNFVSDFRLNGRRVTGIVDTGASTIAINETTARRIGLLLDPSDFRYDVQTANGHVKAAAALIGDIEIGRIRVQNVQAMVLEDRALSTTLVGMSFLNQLSHFSIQGDRLTLVQ